MELAQIGRGALIVQDPGHHLALHAEPFSDRGLRSARGESGADGFVSAVERVGALIASRGSFGRCGGGGFESVSVGDCGGCGHRGDSITGATTLVANLPQPW